MKTANSHALSGALFFCHEVDADSVHDFRAYVPAARAVQYRASSCWALQSVASAKIRLSKLEASAFFESRMQSVSIFGRQLRVLICPLLEKASQRLNSLGTLAVERSFCFTHWFDSNGLTFGQGWRIGIEHNDAVTDMSDIEGCRRRWCFDGTHERNDTLDTRGWRVDSRSTIIKVADRTALIDVRGSPEAGRIFHDRRLRTSFGGGGCARSVKCGRTRLAA